jgi:hypothetical protein
MKKINIFLAAASALCLFSMQTASAQKMMFNSQTAFTVVDERTTTYACTVEEISSLADAEALAAKLAAYKGILKAEASNFAAGKADLLVTVVKNESLFTYKSAIAEAGISTVYLDGKPVKTEDVMNVVASMRQAKR